MDGCRKADGCESAASVPCVWDGAAPGGPALLIFCGEGVVQEWYTLLTRAGSCWANVLLGYITQRSG